MAEKKCSVDGALNKGPWQPEEDVLLKTCVEANGAGRWTSLASKAGLKRCGKSCRLRWMNYLRPNVKRGHITPDEADLIIRLHKLLGNRWSLIAARVPGRTDNDVKNFWNIHLSKKSGRKGVHLKSINSKLKDTTFPNTNSIGDSTKDEMDSKRSTKLNFVPRRLSLERDSILGQSELRMLQNPFICAPDCQYPCSDESTKPSNGLLLQHLIAPSWCNINTPSCNVSYADSDELHSVVYKFPSPLTALVQQNSHGLQSEISDTMQGLPSSNQYHPHSDSFGLIGFVSAFDSNYISNISSCFTNEQPNNLNSQFEYPNCKAESDGFNPFLDEVTKLRNGLFSQNVIAAAAENPNLSTAPYALSSVQKDEFYRIPSPLTTLVKQNSHGFLSDIKQGLRISNQHHSHSDAFGSAFVTGFDSNYIFDSARSFTNLHPNDLNS